MERPPWSPWSKTHHIKAAASQVYLKDGKGSAVERGSGSGPWEGLDQPPF